MVNDILKYLVLTIFCCQFSFGSDLSRSVIRDDGGGWLFDEDIYDILKIAREKRINSVEMDIIEYPRAMRTKMIFSLVNDSVVDVSKTDSYSSGKCYVSKYRLKYIMGYYIQTHSFPFELENTSNCVDNYSQWTEFEWYKISKKNDTTQIQIWERKIKKKGIDTVGYWNLPTLRDHLSFSNEGNLICFNDVAYYYPKEDSIVTIDQREDGIEITKIISIHLEKTANMTYYKSIQEYNIYSYKSTKSCNVISDTAGSLVMKKYITNSDGLPIKIEIVDSGYEEENTSQLSITYK